MIAGLELMGHWPLVTIAGLELMGHWPLVTIAGLELMGFPDGLVGHLESAIAASKASQILAAAPRAPVLPHS